MISTLARIFGIEHLNLAEDVVQETLARALQTWPYYGIPRNPSAWITQVAKNLARACRRASTVTKVKTMQAGWMYSSPIECMQLRLLAA